MLSKTMLLKTLGVILSSVTMTDVFASDIDAESSARLLQDLINKKHIQVDSETGELKVNESVLTILESYDCLENCQNVDFAPGGCGASVGTKCGDKIGSGAF